MEISNPMEISMILEFEIQTPMEISMAHGKFHGPWKFPWAALFHLGRAVGHDQYVETFWENIEFELRALHCKQCMPSESDCQV